jgi:hypothetical protein
MSTGKSKLVQDFRGTATPENLVELEKIIDSGGTVSRFLEYDEDRFGDKKYDDLYFRVFDKFFSYVKDNDDHLPNVNVIDSLFRVSPGYANWKALKDPAAAASMYNPRRDAIFRTVDLLKPAEDALAQEVLSFASEWLAKDDFGEFVKKLNEKFPQPGMYFQVAGMMAQYREDYSPDKDKKIAFSGKFLELIKLSKGHGGHKNSAEQPGFEMYFLLEPLNLSVADFKGYAEIIWAHDKRDMEEYTKIYAEYFEKHKNDLKKMARDIHGIKPGEKSGLIEMHELADKKAAKLKQGITRALAYGGDKEKYNARKDLNEKYPELKEKVTRLAEKARERVETRPEREELARRMAQEQINRKKGYEG